MSKELLAEIIKGSKVEATYLDQKLSTPRTLTHTKIPGVNLMMSGKYDGGFHSGLTIVAAPSKHFKTMLLVMMLNDYLEADPDAIAVLYDSENGASKATFESYGVDQSRVIHKEIMNIENLKFDIMDLLENKLSKGKKVFIGIDSIGNLASKKEVQDSLNENSAADMTRAKQLKSLFRMVTPYLGKYDIPMVAVNHVYSEIGCLDENTMIVMSDLSTKALKDVDVGDSVYTRFGARRVITKHDSEELEKYPHEMYEIELGNGEIIRCTENHRFLVDGEWRRADDLTMSDLIQIAD